MELEYEEIGENRHRIIIYAENRIQDVLERYDDRGCGKEGLFGLAIPHIRKLRNFDSITIDNFLFR